MDYGKLAYIKVEELENRLQKLLNKGDEPVTNFTVNPLYDFCAGDYSIGYASGNGIITLTAKVTMRIDENVTDGTVKLLINGLSAGEAIVSGKIGDTIERVIIASVYINGSAKLSLSCDLPCVLLSVQSVVTGASVNLYGYDGKTAIDGTDGTWAIVSCENDEVGVRVFDESNPVFLEKTFLGAGNQCDVCHTQNGYLFAYIDGNKNAFMVSAGDDGLPVSYRFVSAFADDVAISSYGDSVLLAVLSGGKIVTFVISDDGISQASESSDFGIGKVNSIAFVKGSESPMLIVRTADRSYLWLSSYAQKSVGDSVGLTIVLSAQGADI